MLEVQWHYSEHTSMTLQWTHHQWHYSEHTTNGITVNTPPMALQWTHHLNNITVNTPPMALQWTHLSDITVNTPQWHYSEKNQPMALQWTHTCWFYAIHVDTHTSHKPMGSLPVVLAMEPHPRSGQIFGWICVRGILWENKQSITTHNTPHTPHTTHTTHSQQWPW